MLGLYIWFSNINNGVGLRDQNIKNIIFECY